MATNKNKIMTQMVALLGAATRKTDGTPNYTAAMLDKARASGEINLAIDYAALEVARAICETVGHPFVGDFLEEVEIIHGDQVPVSYGQPTIPLITPFEEADYSIEGVRRGFDKISSYRLNRNKIYSATDHDGEDSGGSHSKLAGYYDIVGGIFYFTGHRATVRLPRFTIDDVYGKLPDALEPVVMRLALGSLQKEGDVSDQLFSAWRQMGMNDLDRIRAGATAFSPVDEAVASRGQQTR